MLDAAICNNEHDSLVHVEPLACCGEVRVERVGLRLDTGGCGADERHVVRKCKLCGRGVGGRGGMQARVERCVEQDRRERVALLRHRRRVAAKWHRH